MDTGFENRELENWFGIIPASKNSKNPLISAFPEYISPSDGKICVVAYHPFPSNKIPNQSLLLTIKECGFDLVCNELDESTIKLTMDELVKVGLESILNCEKYIFEEGHEIFDLYYEPFGAFGNLEGIKGWYFFKNPSFGQLSDPEDYLRYGWNEFKDNEIKEKNLNQIVIIDLCGYPNQSLMEGNTYNDYMNEFQSNFLPSMWSYDFNPISIKGGTLFMDFDTFYFDLEAYALRSKLFNRPFWATCHCASFKEGDFIYPVKEEYIRYEVFSALAYGAKGLKFDSYFQPEDSKSRKFISAPIDANGNKTVIWDSLQKIIKEISAYNNIFAKGEFIECVHTVNQFKGTSKYDTYYSFGPAIKIESSGIGFLVSHIFSDGLDYMILVNHDIQNPQTATIFFADYWTVRMVKTNSYGYILNLPIPKDQTKGLSLEVPPGAYYIFSWK